MSAPAPRVGVIGLGYVGLPLAAAFAEAGVPVLGLDAIQSKVDQINAGRSYIEDVPSDRLGPLTAAGLIRATTNWDEIRQVDAVLICLPTPLDEHREPDLSAVLGAAESLAQRMRQGQRVVFDLNERQQATSLRLGSEVDMGTPGFPQANPDSVQHPPGG